MSTKFIATVCAFSLVEGDWNECNCHVISCWNENVESSCSIIGILNNIHYRDFDSRKTEDLFKNDPLHEKDYSKFNANLIVDYVDGEISKPTLEKLEQFKKATIKLYTLHITVIVKKISNLDMFDVAQFLD